MLNCWNNLNQSQSEHLLVNWGRWLSSWRSQTEIFALTVIHSHSQGCILHFNVKFYYPPANCPTLCLYCTCLECEDVQSRGVMGLVEKDRQKQECQRDAEWRGVEVWPSPFLSSLLSSLSCPYPWTLEGEYRWWGLMRVLSSSLNHSGVLWIFHV